jgi:hypothetical protein
LSCAYGSPFGHYTKFCDLSRDEREYPVVAWDADDARNAIPVVCVSVPTDSGFGIADEIEGSDFGVAPVVGVDRNGDAWVAWRVINQNTGLMWTHTYTTATTTVPRILGTRALRDILWMLSEPAPETWWAVLRSRNGGQYEQVARVRATASQNMRWIDTSPPSGTLRYKIRRECLDTRHQWESAAGHWPPAMTQPWISPAIELSVRVLSGSKPALEIGGAGEAPIGLDVFDLEGRRVLSEPITSARSEIGTVRFDLEASSRRLAPGIYFALAREESGRVSAPAKLLILR